MSLPSDQADASKQQDLGPGKKKATRRPTAAQLTGPRGLEALQALAHAAQASSAQSDRARFKELMALLREWTRQLFPAISFEEAVEAMERLGANAEVAAWMREARQAAEQSAGPRISDGPLE